MVATAHGGPGILHSLEVVETVMEVADIAWEAFERRRRDRGGETGDAPPLSLDGNDAHPKDMSQLREENRRLRAALEENLNLLRSLAKLPVVAEDCPPDLHAKLVTAVESTDFSDQLESLCQSAKDSKDGYFPFKEVRGIDLKSVDIMVYDDVGKPTCWVWVTDEEDVDKVQEESAIDDDHYVIIGQDHIVDGVANFIARCILSNPKSKSLTQDELQKVVSKSLVSMKDASVLKRVWRAAKLMYSLSTWGLALAALYRHPMIVKAAAKGVTTSGKLIMKAF